MTCQRCHGPASATYALIAADDRLLALCEDCADAYGRMAWIDSAASVPTGVLPSDRLPGGSTYRFCLLCEQHRREGHTDHHYRRRRRIAPR